MTATAPVRETRAPITSLLDRIVEQQGSLRAIALLRILMGAIVIRHLWPDVRASRVPVDRFHVPWWSWLPVPSATGYRILLWIGVVAGVAMVAGLWSRLANITALVVVSYLLFVDMTGFAHNRAFLVWSLFGLSLVPSTGSVFTSSDTTGFLWPVTLLRVIVSSVYLTSGLTKLLDPDWRGGLVLWDRVVRHEHSIPFGGWPYDVLTSRWFHHLLAPSAIALELFLAFALWYPRTRLVAIWTALVFHGSIEVAASVQTFSYSAIAALLIWVTPASRDRVLTAPPRLHAVISRLDWLHRFRVHAGQPGQAVTLVDRDGSRREGADATLTALSRVPLLFPITGPVLAIRRLRGRSPRSTS